MKSYLISIIVPAYNIAEYLPRCLDSILSQTYKNLEVIVISDGSTDNTNKVIAKYAEKDSRIIPVFKDNSGVSDTRNKGLEIAKGDYIGFVDGDDYIEPEMYETLLNNLLENDADISHCGYQMVFPSRVDYYYNTGKKVIQDNRKGICDIIVGDYVEPSPCIKLYKKEVLAKLKMPKNIKINEDVLFNFYAFCNSEKSIYEDKPFYHYILRKGSAATSKINDNKLFDPIIVKKEIFEYCCEKHDNEIQSLAYTSYLYSVIALYRTVKNNKIINRKEKVKQYYREIKSIKNVFNLSKRVKIERLLFLYFTPIHMFVYGFYDKHISKNKNKFEVK
ncbi:MAG: glycosyltransferase [Eubacterium sp.]